MTVKRPAAAGARAILAGFAATLLIGVPACADLFFSVRNLDISPSPARPGDTVTFVFYMGLVPAQSYTAIVLIDGAEHTRLTRTEAVDGPVVVEVGDAADLIARYGAGSHVGNVEVQLNERSRTARSGERTFVLEAATP